MKKYILTSLLGLFGFVGSFASAGNITFTSSTTEWVDFPYSPSSFTISKNVSFDYSSVSSSAVCDESASDVGCCVVGFRSQQDFDSDEICYLESDSPDSSCSLTPGTYYVSLNSSDCIAFSSITLPVGDSSSSGGDDSGGSLLPGGEGDLSGIISGLNSVIDEFLPYLVYIGLGLITSTIGFIAVRWLIGRTSSKVRGTFSSGKRKR